MSSAFQSWIIDVYFVLFMCIWFFSYQVCLIVMFKILVVGVLQFTCILVVCE